MREYIRHPSSIPLEIKVADLPGPQSEYLSNVSMGGLSFRSKHKLANGLQVIIRIPLLKDGGQFSGQVVWCKRQGRAYEVGVAFRDKEEAFRTRMVEQICHIEQYKNDIMAREHRELTSEQAAMEWIKKFAGSFPEVITEE